MPGMERNGRKPALGREPPIDETRLYLTSQDKRGVKLLWTAFKMFPLFSTAAAAEWAEVELKTAYRWRKAMEDEGIRFPFVSRPPEPWEFDAYCAALRMEHRGLTDKAVDKARKSMYKRSRLIGTWPFVAGRLLKLKGLKPHSPSLLADMDVQQKMVLCNGIDDEFLHGARKRETDNAMAKIRDSLSSMGTIFCDELHYGNAALRILLKGRKAHA